MTPKRPESDKLERTPGWGVSRAYEGVLLVGFGITVAGALVALIVTAIS